jgi:hypothetical protein
MDKVRRQVHRLQKLADPCCHLFSANHAYQSQRQRDDLLHCLARIERGRRILKDDLDALAQ